MSLEVLYTHQDILMNHIVRYGYTDDRRMGKMKKNSGFFNSNGDVIVLELFCKQNRNYNIIFFK